MRIPSLATKRRARIEIIPLIDIIFFLLATFVMVSLSMVKNRAIPVRLPVAVTGTPQERKTVATISVTEDGAVHLDKQRVTLEQLAERLKEMKETDPDLQVYIHGDEQASFASAIRVLDEVRLVGITKVAIQTRTDSNPQGDQT